MHPDLAHLITEFRDAQDLALFTLRERLQLSLPESNLDWAHISHELNLFERGEGIGIEIKPHGYGVEMRFPHLSIDFDWGDRGEGCGFDLWRLWNHHETNQLIPRELTYDVLKSYFDLACASGELVTDSHLYYLRDERVR